MKAIYAWFKDAYYQVKDTTTVVIPSNFCYSEPNISTTILDTMNQADVNTYLYHSDSTAKSNSDRVGFMKDYLINQCVAEMPRANDDYVVQVKYELYNCDGKPIKTGTVATVAKFTKALINEPVDNKNELKYRDAFVFDGHIEVSIPVVAKYGITNTCKQHPYTFRITNVSILTTVGDSGVIMEEDSQTECFNHSSAGYFCHKPTDYSMNDFSSHFVTNANVGTTMIDCAVASYQLDTEAQYKYITMCEIPMNCECSTVKIDHKLNTINVNIEVMLDNYMEVFNKEDIDAIIDSNNNKPDPEPEHPDPCPEDTDGPVIMP